MVKTHSRIGRKSGGEFSCQSVSWYSSWFGCHVVVCPVCASFRVVRQGKAVEELYAKELYVLFRLGSAVAVEFRQCVFRLVRSSWIAVAHGSHGELVFVGVSRRKVALGTYRNGLAVVVMCVGEGYVPFSCVRFGRGSQVLFSR